MTIPASEAFLRALELTTEDTILKIPSNIVHSVGGGEAAFVQAVCTWARKQTSTNISTFADSAVQSQIEKVSDSLFGLVACIQANCILDKNGIDITEKARSIALDRLSHLQEQNPFSYTRGTEIQILCADHIGLSYPSIFYSNIGSGRFKVRDRAQFQYAARQMSRKLVSAKLAEEWTPEIITAFGAMLYEIFGNTEEHGRRGLNGERLSRSMRGVHAKVYSILPNQLDKIAQDFPPLHRFCLTLNPDAFRQQVTFLELSIFDSGIGFAPSWLREVLADVSNEDELIAIRDCFANGNSSKPDDGYGLGLPRVLRFLKNVKGFLRLRTGRKSLYLDFSSPESLADDGQLQEWSEGNASDFPTVVGALVTLVVPLRKKCRLNNEVLA